MIDITFNDSACGGLKQAFKFGSGKYESPIIDVFITHEDGSVPSPEEIAEARKNVEEETRLKWEKTIPMDGRPDDVFDVGLNWSIGDISDDAPDSAARFRVMEELYGIFPKWADNKDDSDMVQNWQSHVQDNFIKLMCRADSGESLRLWYSDSPDELCGVYWLLAKLRERKIDVPITAVKLPRYENRADDTVTQKASWSEVGPEEWQHYLSFEKPMPSQICRVMASHWKSLQAENAPLRAVLNGVLVGVNADCYDSFIRHIINEQPTIFQEAQLIGTVLGKYKLGIGDAWLALRIEKMVQNGELMQVTAPNADEPTYMRKLKKGKSRYCDSN